MTQTEFYEQVLRSHKALLDTLGASKSRWIQWVYRNSKRRLEHLEKMKNESIGSNDGLYYLCDRCGVRSYDPQGERTCVHCPSEGGIRAHC